MERITYLVVTHRRPVGVMHHPAWEGISVPAEATEIEVLNRLAGEGYELVSVVPNAHDTERRYYFKR